jgi:hypothetical protein
MLQHVKCLKKKTEILMQLTVLVLSPRRWGLCCIVSVLYRSKQFEDNFNLCFIEYELTKLIVVDWTYIGGLWLILLSYLPHHFPHNIPYLVY